MNDNAKSVSGLRKNGRVRTSGPSVEPHSGRDKSVPTGVVGSILYQCPVGTDVGYTDLEDATLAESTFAFYKAKKVTRSMRRQDAIESLL